MSQFTAVLDAVKAASAELDEFTTDDVWPRLGFEPDERNMVGKAFSEAARLGYITGTERFVRSRRPEAKGRRVQVWTASRTPTPGLFGR